MSGSVGKIDNGIVSVNAYGICHNLTFPLICKIFKPQKSLLSKDSYKTKIELANEMVEELIDFGFTIELVLADSLYGESSSFLDTLDKYQIPWIVAIRTNHRVWMLPGQIVRKNRWCKIERIFSNGTSEIRSVREIIFGKRYERIYWEITTDPETMPENTTADPAGIQFQQESGGAFRTSFVMTNLKGKTNQIKKTLGNLYGLRTWVGNKPEFNSGLQARPHSAVEYGFRQCK